MITTSIVTCLGSNCPNHPITCLRKEYYNLNGNVPAGCFVFPQLAIWSILFMSLDDKRWRFEILYVYFYWFSNLNITLPAFRCQMMFCHNFKYALFSVFVSLHALSNLFNFILSRLLIFIFSSGLSIFALPHGPKSQIHSSQTFKEAEVWKIRKGLRAIRENKEGKLIYREGRRKMKKKILKGINPKKIWNLVVHLDIVGVWV